MAQELDYKFDTTENSEGWHSSSYSFTNDEIKAEIVDMRNAFDNKYSSANVLISTGHTISLSSKLNDDNAKKIILYDNTVISLSNITNFNIVDTYKKAVLGKWRRRDCFVYFIGMYAELVNDKFKNLSVKEAMELGFTTNTIYDLLNEGFIDIVNYGDGKQLKYYADNQIKFVYGNKFNELKWYGYYDAN